MSSDFRGIRRSRTLSAAAVLALGLGASLQVQAADFVIVNNDEPGVGFNDTTPVSPVGNNPETTLGEQRMFAVESIADIWGALLESQVTIGVQTQWIDLECNQNSAVLGSAGTTNLHANFNNAPVANTWFHAALADSIDGTDLNGANEEINMNININLDGDPNCFGGRTWYLGLDGNNPGGTVDLVPLVLHELGHGLGFSTFVNGENGSRPNDLNDIYMRNLRDTEVDLGWDEMTDAERADSAINDPNLVWTGANVAANDSDFVGDPAAFSEGFLRMHAPAPLNPGSSVSHWAAGPWVLLMEPSLSFSLFDQVDLTIDLFADIGWQTTVATDVLFIDGFE